MNKLKVIVSTTVMSFLMITIAYAGQWKEDNGWKYQRDDGNYVTNDWCTGNDGNLYYLKNDGIVSTGWFQVNNNWFYATADGAIVKNKWVKSNGSYYYLGPDGKMVTNTNVDGYNIGEDGKRMKSSQGYEVSKPTLVTSSTKKENGKIPAGKYIVYVAEGTPHIRIIGGSECMADVYNFIELSEGDTTTVNGLYVSADDERNLDISTSGMFEVGKDIAEGTYTVNADRPEPNRVNISICTVFNSVPSSKDSEKPENNIASDNYVYSQPLTITVKKGQFLQLINCTADLKRPENQS